MQKPAPWPQSRPLKDPHSGLPEQAHSNFNRAS
jgi:hypothetical protein